MLNKSYKGALKITIAAALLAMPAMAQAVSTGLLLSDDSVQIPYNKDAAPVFDVEVRQTYNFLYSQEPVPRSFLLSGGIEFLDHGWEFGVFQKITPKVDFMLMKFKDYFVAAAAIGASHRLSLNEEQTFSLQTEATLAPQLTTLARGKYLWNFKTQLNYPFTNDVEFNLGYRSMTVKLLNDDKDGFERGLYFGITKKLE